MAAYPSREVPPDLAALWDLALDLRWTWSHKADALWQTVDAASWEQCHNPWVILQDLPESRACELAADPAFMEQLQRVVGARR